MNLSTQMLKGEVTNVEFIRLIGNLTTENKVPGRSNSRGPDPVTNEMRVWILFVNYFLLCGCGSLFGIVVNIINIFVFLKQGFKDSINISLLGLAISDLASLVTLLWMSICSNKELSSAGLPFDTNGLMYYFGGWPHACFNRLTSLITVFITLERCLCIILPLKVKNIITPFRTKVIIISIFVINLIIFSPFYSVNVLGWSFNKTFNRTILILFYTDKRAIVETITFPIHSVGLSVIALFSVIFCTILLVVNLNRKTRWRESSMAQTPCRQDTASTKDRRVVKMITSISTIFIICYIPPTTIFVVMAHDPEFSFYGHFANMFYNVWGISLLLESFNSSVNIFIYFNMSSKFRNTLIKSCCVHVKEKNEK